MRRTCTVPCWTNFRDRGCSHEQALRTWPLCGCVDLNSCFPKQQRGARKVLKDQLVGTWIYVSRRASVRTAAPCRGQAPGHGNLHGRRPLPLHHGAHRGAEVCVGRSSTTVPRGSHGRCVGRGCLRRDLQGGRKHEDGSPQHRDEFGSEFRRSARSARIVTSITDEELKLTNPRTPAGVTLELVFKRAK